MSKIVILGAGESGAGAAVLAKKEGFEVFVSDMSKIKDNYKKLMDEHNIEWEEELIYGIAAHIAALCQRPPAYGTGMLCYLLEVIGKGDVVPSHIPFDVIVGYTLLVQCHLYGAGGEVHHRHMIGKPLHAEQTQGLIAQDIVAHSTHSHGLEAMLTCMIGKIGRCTTQFRTSGKNIEKHFSESHYIRIFLFHIFVLLNWLIRSSFIHNHACTLRI